LGSGEDIPQLLRQRAWVAVVATEAQVGRAPGNAASFFGRAKRKARSAEIAFPELGGHLRRDGVIISLVSQPGIGVIGPVLALVFQPLFRQTDEVCLGW